MRIETEELIIESENRIKSERKKVRFLENTKTKAFLDSFAGMLNLFGEEHNAAITSSTFIIDRTIYVTLYITSENFYFQGNAGSLLTAIEEYYHDKEIDWETRDMPAERVRTYECLISEPSLSMRLTVDCRLSDDATCQIVVIGHETVSKYRQITETVPITKIVCL
jgi:hypothetical protein